MKTDKTSGAKNLQNNNSSDDDIDLSFSFTLNPNKTKSTTPKTTTTNVNAIPNHENLVNSNAQNAASIVTVIDPSAIKFPDDNDNRNQLTFHKIETTTPSPGSSFPTVNQLSYTYANCGSVSNANNSKVSATADSELFVFPNGTKVSISKCQIFLILNRNKNL